MKKWLDSVIESYPSESRELLKRGRDQFSNPLGCTIRDAMGALLDALLNSEDDSESLHPVLDSVLRIRAVQDCSPSEAVSFIYLLKKTIRDEVKRSADKTVFYGELLDLETRIDHIACVSFDIYMACREKLYEVRANELKRNTFGLLKSAKIVHDEETLDSGLKRMRYC